MRYIFVVLLFTFFSCEQEQEFSAPHVFTGFVSNVTETSAQFNGLVTNEIPPGSEVGFYIMLNEFDFIDKGTKVPVTTTPSKGSFSISINFESYPLLLANKTYYVRAYGLKGKELITGTSEPFTTGRVSGWDEVKFGPSSPTLNRRANASAFVINGEAYYGLGLASTSPYLNQYVKDFWKFSAKSNTWTKVADFPGKERMNAVSFVINNIGYVGLGNNNDDYFGNPAYKELWAYDPASNTWTRKADHPTTRLGLAGVVYFSIGNKGYVGLGNDGSKDFWEYNPTTNAWTRLNDFPGGARSASAVFTGNGKAYVGLGFNGSVPVKDLWEYNPNGDQWTRKQDFPSTARTNVLTIAKDARRIVFSGESSGTFYKEAWEYDMSNDSWKRSKDYIRQVTYASSIFTIDDTSYVLSGRDIFGSYFTTYLTYTWR